MNLQVEHLESHEAKLTLEFSPEEFRKAQSNVAKKLSKEYRVPGFRPGHVPTNVIVKIVGEENFRYEIADDLARAHYSQALDSAQIPAYGQGKIEDIKENPFLIVVRVEKQPAVDLKDYKNIRVAFDEPEVSAEEIQSQLEAMQNENAIVALAERPAKDGDMVEGKIVAYNENDEAVFDLEEKEFVLDINLDTAMHLPGLKEAIVGMSAGESKTVHINIDETEEDENLRGKDVAVHIQIERVNSRELPPIDDTLAQTVGSFDNVADLREDVKKRVLEYKKSIAMSDYNDLVVNTFTEQASVIYPPSYLSDRLDEAVDDLKNRAKNTDKIEFSDWLKLQGYADEAALRNEIKESVENRAKVNLVLGEMSKAEKVTVSSGDMISEMNSFAQSLGDNKLAEKLFRNQEYLSGLYNRRLTNSVITRMTNIALGKGETTPEIETISKEPEPGN
jgi:trigger factor